MFRPIKGVAPLALAASLLLAGCGGTPSASGTSVEAAGSGPAVAETTANGSPPAQQSNGFKPAPPILRMVELNSWYRSVLVEREATRNPRELEALVRPVCEGLEVCRVGVWTDKWTMPQRMPVRAPQLEALEFAFGRNAKGEETSLWNCSKYPEFEAEGACLPQVLK